jgi:hypothetical protein
VTKNIGCSGVLFREEHLAELGSPAARVNSFETLPHGIY